MTSEKEITCIVCPIGCKILVRTDGILFELLDGNKCKKGIDYARNEALEPRRMLTSSVLVKNANKQNKYINVKAGKGIWYVVPQRLNKPGEIRFTLRVEKPCESPALYVIVGDKELLKKKLPWANPANMVEFDVNISAETIKSNDNLEVLLDD